MKYFMVGILFGLILSSVASAHEMTPTYPKLTPSYMDNVYKTTMEMFNKREDVEYYEIGVFDKDFNPIPFVSSYEIINLKYLGHVTFDIYIRKQDVSRATYVCSMSKIRKDSKTKTAITSRICSKFK
jgi:hypothetical protein